MTKRSNRLKKAIESLKEQIEEHFNKLDNDIENNDFELAGYYAREIDKSLVVSLENKINFLGKDSMDEELIKKYRGRLKEYEKKLENIE